MASPFERTTDRALEAGNGRRAGMHTHLAQQLAQQYTGTIESGVPDTGGWGPGTLYPGNPKAQAEHWARTFYCEVT